MTATLVRSELPTFLLSFAAMHDAMRRDARRLTAAVPHLGPAEARAVHAWWERYAATIHHHHTREDELVWPALEARTDRFSAELAGLHDDHAALDRAMAELRDRLVVLAAGAGSVAETAEAARAFADVLFDHLEREEAAAFPEIAERFTAEEYEEVEVQIRKGSSLAQIGFELPWILDGARPEVLDHLEGVVPGWGHVLNRLVFTPRYRRTAQPLLQAAR